MQIADLIPPHAPDIERAVIGAMLLDAKAIEKAVELTDETVFYNPVHSMIFEAIRKLYGRGERVDMLTVAELLREQKRLDAVGGEATLAGLSGETRSTANIQYHCAILVDKAQKRRAMLCAQQLLRKAAADDGDATELLVSTEKEIECIIAVSRQKMHQPMTDVIPAAYRLIEERANSQTGLTGITTGFPRLNKYTSGWQKSDLIFIAALPSCGKTTIGMNCVVAAARTGHTVGIFSIFFPR